STKTRRLLLFIRQEANGFHGPHSHKVFLCKAPLTHLLFSSIIPPQKTPIIPRRKKPLEAPKYFFK
ncbi:Hypothetical protein FKW44_014682, partial [Caligus rogercresseyi]